MKSFQTSTNQMRKKKIQKISFFWHDPFLGYAAKPKKVQIANRHAKINIKMYFKQLFLYFLWYNTFCLWNITTKINFSQPDGVNVILQTVRQIDTAQNKAVPDDPYARLFKAAPSCLLLFPNPTPERNFII